MIVDLLAFESAVKLGAGIPEILVLSDPRKRLAGGSGRWMLSTVVDWTGQIEVCRCLTGSRSTVGSASRQQRRRDGFGDDQVSNEDDARVASFTPLTAILHHGQPRRVSKLQDRSGYHQAKQATTTPR